MKMNSMKTELHEFDHIAHTRLARGGQSIAPHAPSRPLLQQAVQPGGAGSLPRVHGVRRRQVHCTPVLSTLQYAKAVGLGGCV